MLSKVSRAVVPLTLLSLLAGCNSSSGLSDAAPQPQTTAPPQAGAVVVQATCPQIFMRDGTAYHRVYARGGEGDPDRLVYQASFADTTRSCTTDGNQVTINVMAHGRIVAGPAGQAGAVSLPVRVVVTETNAVQKEETIYSQLVQYQADIPAGALAGQFLFNKADVAIPSGSAQNAKVYISFDAGPQAAARR